MSAMLTMDVLRPCLEGIVPAGIATHDADGMPNVTYVSQLMYVDPEHVALSFQFFNKTRDNILANLHATVLMMDPETAARYRVSVRYLRTETAGPLFERMKAKLAGIASQTGMSDVFRLLGADIYRVLAIEPVPGRELPPAPLGPALLPALRRSLDTLRGCQGLDGLIDTLGTCLERHFGLRHQMLWMADEAAQRLYLVSSRGYASSGAGAELPYGLGVIGVAARERVPIRIMFPTADYAYSRLLGEPAGERGGEPVIALPGMADPASQLAVPIIGCDRLMGVLYLESDMMCRFGYDLEDALVALCAPFGLAMRALQAGLEPEDEAPAGTRPVSPSGAPLRVRHFARDGSVFLDDDYLIKGVAGAILWKLLNEHEREGRQEFSNRELRLDASLGLPEVGDNLDARLILLARRLVDRNAPVRIEKTGRGRFRLLLERPVRLMAEGA